MEQHQASICTHRWMLGEPQRGRIQGVCRRCGAQRPYPSGLDIHAAVADSEELDLSRPLIAKALGSLQGPSLV